MTLQAGLGKSVTLAGLLSYGGVAMSQDIVVDLLRSVRASLLEAHRLEEEYTFDPALIEDKAELIKKYFVECCSLSYTSQQLLLALGLQGKAALATLLKDENSLVRLCVADILAREYSREVESVLIGIIEIEERDIAHGVDYTTRTRAMKARYMLWLLYGNSPDDYINAPDVFWPQR